jgi:hypothetical protein
MVEVNPLGFSHSSRPCMLSILSSSPTRVNPQGLRAPRYPRYECFVRGLDVGGVTVCYAAAAAWGEHRSRR